MPILYSNPSEVGADRIVNAIAAFEQYGARGVPLIVVRFRNGDDARRDVGAGEYLGGAICPGVADLGRRAVPARRAAAAHRRAKARDRDGPTTVGAMESGLFSGYVGMVEGLVRRMEPNSAATRSCVATGGLAVVIAPETKLIAHVDVELTLHGLRMVWERRVMRCSGGYCREIESYLCRKNDGHLIRVVGPSFDLVAAGRRRAFP